MIAVLPRNKTIIFLFLEICKKIKLISIFFLFFIPTKNYSQIINESDTNLHNIIIDTIISNMDGQKENELYYQPFYYFIGNLEDNDFVVDTILKKNYFFVDYKFYLIDTLKQINRIQDFKYIMDALDLEYTVPHNNKKSFFLLNNEQVKIPLINPQDIDVITNRIDIRLDSNQNIIKIYPIIIQLSELKEIKNNEFVTYAIINDSQRKNRLLFYFHLKKNTYWEIIKYVCSIFPQ